MSIRSCLSVGLALAAPALVAAAPAPSPLPKDLDAYILKALQTFETPGAAVAVVKDGRIVLAKGYGMKKLGDPAPVTERTRFQIASNSKAFTAALLAQFVDEGRLKWDDRVIDHLPWFRLHDPYATREFTVRDLLTHRSGLGLGAGDLLWFRSGYGRREILERFRAIAPVTSFRSAYAYDNVLYIAAGEVAAALGGKSWETLVEERIFQPLGMASATPVFRASADDATPHAPVDGIVRPVAPDRDDAAAAAAGIQVNVQDLAAWVKVQLDEGRIDGTRRIFTEARSREMFTAVTPQPIRPTRIESLKPLTPAFAAYGLGWELRDYRGVKVATHTGALTGTTSRVLLVPEKKLGIIALTNGENRVWDAIIWRILDHQLGLPFHDWTAAFQEARDAGLKHAAEVQARLAAAKPAGGQPSLPLSGFAGAYRDAWYGDAALAEENGRLVLRFKPSPTFVGDLEFWGWDTFKVRWRERTIPDAFLTFAINEEGRPVQFTMKAISPLADFSFNFHDLSFTPVP